MTIYWELRVKFRALGITWGTLNKTGALPVSVPAIPAVVDKVLVDERGVYLRVRVE